MLWWPAVGDGGVTRMTARWTQSICYGVYRFSSLAFPVAQYGDSMYGIWLSKLYS